MGEGPLSHPDQPRRRGLRNASAAAPSKARRAAPRGSALDSASPTRQPAHPPEGGSAGGPIGPGSPATTAVDTGAAKGPLPTSQSPGPAASCRWPSRRCPAPRGTGALPARGAKATFCAATVPLLCSPAGGPPRYPASGSCRRQAPSRRGGWHNAPGNCWSSSAPRRSRAGFHRARTPALPRWAGPPGTPNLRPARPSRSAGEGG